MRLILFLAHLISLLYFPHSTLLTTLRSHWPRSTSFSLPSSSRIFLFGGILLEDIWENAARCASALSLPKHLCGSCTPLWHPVLDTTEAFR
ncbi:hypothetical protein B0H13DRAFT_2101017 [Mycena leptocephala]|nr:hypothetical protein B0H13DRAFT_2101017 [Mycena leptocephala]